MKILFLAYEVESNAIAELSNHYTKKGHDCFILNCDFWTFLNNKDFYKVYDGKCNNFYNLEDEYNCLDKTISPKDIDYKFLSDFETKYNFYFNDLMRCDPILYTATHERDFYNIPPGFIKYKWMELLAKKLENICLENNIDKIVSISNNYFVKNLAYAISPKLNIEYLCILPTRIDGNYMVYDNFGIGSPRLITENINNVGDRCSKEAQDMIDSVAIKGNSAYAWELNSVNENINNNYFKNFIQAIKYAIYLLRNNFSMFFKNKKYKNKYFAPKPIKEIMFSFRNNVIRKYFLERSKILNKNISKGISYYYYGLHRHPESTLLTFSKIHDEIEPILRICADLDIDTYLVVKENISMLGHRHHSFYEKLSSIPNLILLHPSVNSINLIKNSKGTIGLAGTLLVEANMCNKHAFGISVPEYTALSFVKNYSKENLNDPNLFKDNNIKNYVQLILINGTKLDMHIINYYPYRKSFNKNKWEIEVMKMATMLDRYIK